MNVEKAVELLRSSIAVSKSEANEIADLLQKLARAVDQRVPADMHSEARWRVAELEAASTHSAKISVTQVALRYARDALQPLSVNARGVHASWSDERHRGSLNNMQPILVGDCRKAAAAVVMIDAALALQQSEQEYLDVQRGEQPCQSIGMVRELQRQARPICLVATGKTHNGEETYTRHEGAPPPLCDFERLWTFPQVEPPSRQQVEWMNRVIASKNDAPPLGSWPLASWPIHGIRVDEGTVVIVAKGGVHDANHAARWMCEQMLKMKGS